MYIYTNFLSSAVKENSDRYLKTKGALTKCSEGAKGEPLKEKAQKEVMGDQSYRWCYRESHEKKTDNLTRITNYDLPSLRTEDCPYKTIFELLQIRHRNMNVSLSLWSTTRILPM